MFQFVLKIAAARKLIDGKTVGVDSTTLEANAAMKSIVRRDTGEDWKQYVTRLMREEGVIEKEYEPTDEEIRSYDKARKNKKVSNEDWVSPHDPESRITQLKDGRTHLAYKTEHVVDLEHELVVAAEIRSGDAADTATLCDSVLKAQENLQGAELEASLVHADKTCVTSTDARSCQTPILCTLNQSGVESRSLALAMRSLPRTTMAGSPS